MVSPRIITVNDDDTVESLIGDACAIARTLQRTVQFDFDGEIVLVEPHSTPEGILSAINPLLCNACGHPHRSGVCQQIIVREDERYTCLCPHFIQEKG